MNGGPASAPAKHRGWTVATRAAAFVCLALFLTPVGALVVGPSPSESATSTAPAAVVATSAAADGDPAPAVPAPMRSPSPPPAFIENAGQLGREDVRFSGRFGPMDVGFAPGVVLYLITDRVAPTPATPGSIPSAPVPAGATALVEVTFPGAHAVVPEGRGVLESRSNFFRGADPSQWVAGVRSYREVVYAGLWPGIDLLWRASPEGAKYEFTVAPGADASLIRLEYAGTDGLTLAPNGDLVAATALGAFNDSAPVAWQGAGQPANCGFVLPTPTTAGFTCTAIDPALPLTIDPLVFSSYVGGTDYDVGNAIAVDADGNPVVAGFTYSTNFPTTTGAYDTSRAPGYDLFVSKFSSDGTSLLYSTYIGGSSYDYAYAIALDAAGNAYITGTTSSSDYPTTAGALMTFLYGSQDAFVTRLNSSGSALDYSTYLGGSQFEYGYGIGVDRGGNATVAGFTYSPDFPVTAGAYDTTGNGSYDGFVTRLAANGSNVQASTLYGGASTDYLQGLAVGSDGSAYVTGYTYSSDLPTTSGAWSQRIDSGPDAFVAKLSSNFSVLSYGTYLGASSTDVGYSIAVNAAGIAYVGGYTYSSDFPTTSGVVQRNYGAAADGFITKLDGAGDIIWSTFLGGDNTDILESLAVSSAGQVFVTGYTYSTDFPTAGAPLATKSGGGYDIFAARIDAPGSPLIYSTYFGGMSDEYGHDIAVDANGTAYITGQTYSTNFPLSANAFQIKMRGNWDAFAVKIDMRLPRITLDTVPAGLSFSVNGTNVTAPITFSCGGSRLIYASSPQVNGTTRFVFSSWSDGGGQLHAINCTADGLFVATFSTQYAAVIQSSPPGLLLSIDSTNVTAPATIWWGANTNHTILAWSPQIVGPSRYAFINWSDAGDLNHTVNASGPLNLTASFQATEHAVTITTAPTRLQIIVDGATLVAPFSVWWPIGSPHSVDLPSPQPGVPGTRFVFSGWSDGGAINHSFSVNEPLTLTANFIDEFQIVIDTDPAGLNILVDGEPLLTPLVYWWANGTSHTLNVPALTETGGDTRFAFNRWADVAPENRTVRSDGPITYRAVFIPSSYRVILDSSPSGLDLEIDGSLLPTPQTLWWLSASDHVVTAPASQSRPGGRFLFSQWSDRLQRSHTLTAYTPLNVTAFYTAEFEVTVVSDPPGFQVLVDGASVTTPWTVWWRAATDHRLAVGSPQKGTADTRYLFASWSDGGAQNHTANVSAPTTLTAVFAAEYRLTADSPYALPSCDHSTCWYRSGETATISVQSPRAASLGSQYVFVRWSGDLTTETAEATLLMDGPKRLTAVWKTQFLLTVTSPYGEVTGGGWFDDGASAPYSISVTELTNITGDPGATLRFVGWSGSAASGSPHDTIVMDAPKTIAADWVRIAPEAPVDNTPEQTPNAPTDAGLPLWPILLALAAAAGVAMFLVARRRRDDDDETTLAALAPAGAVVVDAPQAPAPPAPPIEHELPPAAPAPPPPPAASAAPPKTVSLEPAAVAVAPAAVRPVKRTAAPKPAPPPVPETDPCPDCGEPLEFGWAVCPACGMEIEWG